MHAYHFLTFNFSEPVHVWAFAAWIVGCWEFSRAYVAWVRSMWALG